jgi:hypothetical protein
MPLLEVRHLTEIADRTTGKTQLGELVRRLVYATVARQQPHLHFLSGETNGYPGWDGWVEVQVDESGGPIHHRSVWELSTDKDFRSKFRRDYASATTKSIPHGWQRSAAIYVGLTLRSVPPTTLTSIRKSLLKDFGCPWAGVVLLAAGDLLQWLEKANSVEDWASVEFQVGPGRFGKALEHWFGAWARQTTPNVTEGLLRSGRDLTPLRAAFNVGSPQVTTLQCDSVEEAVALVYCAAKSLADDDAAIVLASLLVVVDDVLADRLADQPVPSTGMPIVVLTPPATKHRNRLAQAGFRVIQALGRLDDSPGVIRFERASAHDFSKALTDSMRIESVQAEIQARACGSSVSIWHIRNLFGGAVQPVLPEWAGPNQADAVVAAVFAGAWRESAEPDMRVMTALSGMDEARLASSLAPFAACTTPLIEFIGSDRLVVAPTAAFEFMRLHITRHHIQRLTTVCHEVFGAVSEAVDEHWRGSEPDIPIVNNRESMSGGLKDGLASTLLRIAVLGAPLVGSGAIEGHTTPQTFVDHIVRSLPGLSSDGRVLASLDRQLPDLVEAAPTPFLDALDALLQGSPTQLRLMFGDQAGIFGRSFHTGLLWGLEGLAWSPELLPRVASSLAALCQVDPGGTLSNRPFRSLAEIFLAWHPGTSSGPEQRAHVLQTLATQYPDVGWALLVDLLPGHRRTASPTHKPRWRSWGQTERGSIRRSEMVAAYELYVDLALVVAGTDARKLADLIEDYPQFLKHHKDRLEVALRESNRRDATPESIQRLWSRLNRLCTHHRNFPTADWAMPAEDIDRLQAICDGLLLSDPVLRHRWLFDEQFPDVGGKGDPYEDRAEDLLLKRRTALEEILGAKGWDGVHELVTTSHYSYIVGSVVGTLPGDDHALLAAMDAWAARATDATWMAFRSVSPARYAMRGSAWTDTLLSFARSRSWNAMSVGMSLVDYPDTRETYATVAQLSSEEQSIYWTRRFGHVRGSKDDLAAFQIGVAGFLAHGRAIDLIDQNWHDLPILGEAIVFQVLDSFIASLPTSTEGRGLGTLEHDIKHLFKWLRRQANVDVADLARREYALLPLLRSYGRGEREEDDELALHRQMRERPEFFVEAVCDLYKSSSEDSQEPETEPSATVQARAHAAFELLESWRTPPGVVNKVISEERLAQWVDAARSLLKAAYRSEIGDQQIGKLLYHLPRDHSDGAFPPLALRTLLERWRSDEIERGIEIEAFNSRGVTSRAMFEGGTQEHSLAGTWRAYAAEIGARWPRSMTLCMRIADMWEDQARRHDTAARRGRAKQSR